MRDSLTKNQNHEGTGSLIQTLNDDEVVAICVHKGDGSFCVHVAQELLTNINKNTSRSLLK